MSKYSPTVQVHALDLGDALSAGADSYLQMKQLQDQRDELAARTGIGIQWPTPSANPPVSIMGTSAPVPQTTTSPSAPLPGVGGLPSPGRVQGMNMPNSDLGPALQTGQQRQIGGVAQPHDDLRDAISNVGKQGNAAGNEQPPIMSLAGQSYTPSPTAPTMDENTMLTLPSGRQLPYGQTSFGRQQALLGERIGGQYGMQNLRGDQRNQQIALTNQGRLAVTDLNGQYHDLITGEQIDSREMIAGQNNATRVKTTGMRDDTQVQTTGMRDDTSQQNHDTPSGSTIYRTTHPTSGAAVPLQKYVLSRVPQLMKADKFGRPGMSQADAQQQALEEYTSATDAATPAPVKQATPAKSVPSAPVPAPSSSTNPTTLAAHQKIDADLAAAVKAGADPQKAMARASQLHAQVGRSQGSSGNIDLSVQ